MAMIVLNIFFEPFACPFLKMIEENEHVFSRGMVDLGVSKQDRGPKCLFSLARRAVCKVVRGLLLFD